MCMCVYLFMCAGMPNAQLPVHHLPSTCECHLYSLWYSISIPPALLFKEESFSTGSNYMKGVIAANATHL